MCVGVFHVILFIGMIAQINPHFTKEDGRTMITKTCRDCEYYDDGTGLSRTAKSGDCYNRLSDKFNPEANHSCSAFYPNTSIFNAETIRRFYFPDLEAHK